MANSVVVLALCAVVAPTATAQLVSPGFETGPNVASISFVQTGPSPLIWLASNTDGERIRGNPVQPAAEGDFYACVLQNSGANPGTTVGLGPFGFTGFDRIHDTFSVMPSTTYEVTLQHASGNRFNYFANTSLITIESVDNVSILQSVSTPTPGLFAWTQLSFQFTTDATTTTAAITLSCTGASNCSALYDDIKIREAGECWLFMGAGPTQIPVGQPTDLLLVMPLASYPVTTTRIPRFRIPDDPQLAGFAVYLQVGMYNPGLFPNDPLQLSNGLKAILGHGAQAYGNGGSGIKLWATQPPVLGDQLVVTFSIPGM